MVVDLWSKVYNDLKELLKNCQYNPHIYRIPPQKSAGLFPIIILSEITNQNTEKATRGTEGVDVIGFQVDLYISPKNPTEEKFFAQDSEITKIVDNYMCKIGLTRMSSQPTPNVDSTIFRRLSRYEGNVSTRTGKIYN